MRFSPILLLILLLSACCPSLPPTPTSEEALNREAELLIRAILPDRLVPNTVDYYRSQISSIVPSQRRPPEESKPSDEILQPLIEPASTARRGASAIYQRYFTTKSTNALLLPTE